MEGLDDNNEDDGGAATGNTRAAPPQASNRVIDAEMLIQATAAGLAAVVCQRAEMHPLATLATVGSTVAVSTWAMRRLTTDADEAKTEAPANNQPAAQRGERLPLFVAEEDEAEDLPEVERPEVVDEEEEAAQEEGEEDADVANEEDDGGNDEDDDASWDLPNASFHEALYDPDSWDQLYEMMMLLERDGLDMEEVREEIFLAAPNYRDVRCIWLLEWAIKSCGSLEDRGGQTRESKEAFKKLAKMLDARDENEQNVLHKLVLSEEGDDSFLLDPTRVDCLQQSIWLVQKYRRKHSFQSVFYYSTQQQRPKFGESAWVLGANDKDSRTPLDLAAMQSHHFFCAALLLDPAENGKLDSTLRVDNRLLPDALSCATNTTLPFLTKAFRNVCIRDIFGDKKVKALSTYKDRCAVYEGIWWPVDTTTLPLRREERSDLHNALDRFAAAVEIEHVEWLLDSFSLDHPPPTYPSGKARANLVDIAIAGDCLAGLYEDRSCVEPGGRWCWPAEVASVAEAREFRSHLQASLRRNGCLSSIKCSVLEYIPRAGSESIADARWGESLEVLSDNECAEFWKSFIASIVAANEPKPRPRVTEMIRFLVSRFDVRGIPCLMRQIRTNDAPMLATLCDDTGQINLGLPLLDASDVEDGGEIVDEEAKAVPDEDCAICYTPIQTPATLPCGHGVNFCISCMRRVFQLGDDRCPLCRASAPPQPPEFHPSSTNPYIDAVLSKLPRNAEWPEEWLRTTAATLGNARIDEDVALIEAHAARALAVCLRVQVLCASAVIYESPSCFAWLCRQEAVNTRDVFPGGRNLLHLAVEYNSTICMLLIYQQEGLAAALDGQYDNDGYRPFHHCIMSGTYDLFQLYDELFCDGQACKVADWREFDYATRDGQQWVELALASTDPDIRIDALQASTDETLTRVLPELLANEATELDELYECIAERVDFSRATRHREYDLDELDKYAVDTEGYSWKNEPVLKLLLNIVASGRLDLVVKLRRRMVDERSGPYQLRRGMEREYHGLLDRMRAAARSAPNAEAWGCYFCACDAVREYRTAEMAVYERVQASINGTLQEGEEAVEDIDAAYDEVRDRLAAINGKIRTLIELGADEEKLPDEEDIVCRIKMHWSDVDDQLRKRSLSVEERNALQVWILARARSRRSEILAAEQQEQ